MRMEVVKEKGMKAGVVNLPRREKGERIRSLCLQGRPDGGKGKKGEGEGKRGE